MQFGYSSRNNFPPVVKNLLIINVLMFLGSMVMTNRGVDMINLLGMHYPQSDLFKPWQVITHLFMHADEVHLLFNMFNLWMFGRTLELVWGQKRFFNFYFLTAFGAILLYYLVVFIQVQNIDPGNLKAIIDMGGETFWDRIASGSISYQMARDGVLVHGAAVGASGAIYGLLGATYVLFPNTTVYLYFAIPIKMKYIVLGLAGLALYMGLMNNAGDTTAHFAHLGGLVAGILIVKYWNKTNKNSFY